MVREVARAQKWCTICHDDDFGRSRNRYTFRSREPCGLDLSSLVGISTMATSGYESDSWRVVKAGKAIYINPVRLFPTVMHQRIKNKE